MRKKLDKIFDNKYEEKEMDFVSNMSFNISSVYNQTGDPEDEIHSNILYGEIQKMIVDSEFERFNQLDENGNIIKLNKVQINQVYSYVITGLPNGYRKIEIWSMLSEYFDIYPTKFYTSLSNKFKHDLVEELDVTTNILEKKKIRKLF